MLEQRSARNSAEVKCESSTNAYAAAVPKNLKYRNGPLRFAVMEHRSGCKSAGRALIETDKTWFYFNHSHLQLVCNLRQALITHKRTPLPSHDALTQTLPATCSPESPLPRDHLLKTHTQANMASTKLVSLLVRTFAV